MTTTVLASFPSPGQGVWHLGPFPIRAYALCIIAGIIAALMIGDRRWVARGGERGVIYDIALWAVPFGLVGGRLYHLMTDWKTYFGPGGAGIGAALRIWEGGLGIWGAVALGGVGAWIACRRRGIPLPAFGDAVAPGVVLAQAIGRLGNYFNQELYGRETAVPWGMEVFYRRDAAGVVDVHSLDGVSTGQVAAVVHPTFLYELLWNVLVFVFLIWADRRFRLGHGRLFALYVAAYCVGRFWVELMRDDTATHIAGIRINVFTATFVFIGALVYILLAPKGREDPATLYGTRPLDAAHRDALDHEWTEDLISAAKGSGVLAAATVAGDHEAEDSEAVGDISHAAVFADADTTVTDADTAFIEVVAADDTEGKGDATDSAAVVVGGSADDVPDDSAATVVYAADTVEAEGAEANETGAEDAADTDDTVVVYHSADEADTVVVYGSEAGDDDTTVIATELADVEADEAEAPVTEVLQAEVHEAATDDVETAEAVIVTEEAQASEAHTPDVEVAEAAAPVVIDSTDDDQPAIDEVETVVADVDPEADQDPDAEAESSAEAGVADQSE